MFDYYLHVDLIVKASDQEAFESAADEFCKEGAFDQFGEDYSRVLVLGIKSRTSFQVPKETSFSNSAETTYVDRRTNPDEAVVRYVNVWKLPAPPKLDIADLMAASADSKTYRRLDALIVRELQNLIVPVRWSKIVSAQTMDQNYVRVTRQLRSADLGTYLFQLGVLLPELQRNGWFSLGIFQNVTGPLNTVTELWRTKGTHELASFEAALAHLDGTPFGNQVVVPFKNLPIKDVREGHVLAPYVVSAPPIDLPVQPATVLVMPAMPAMPAAGLA